MTSSRNYNQNSDNRKRIHERFSGRRFLLQNCIYPAYEVITGRRILEKLKFLEDSQWWSYDQLLEYQLTKIKKLLNFTFENNPYYRRIFLKSGFHPNDFRNFNDFLRLPIIRKDDILEHLNEFISKGYNKNELLKDMTSGSTGQRLIFYIDRNSLDYRSAAVLRNRDWYNKRIGDKQIILWGTEIGAGVRARIVGRIRDLMMGDKIISSYELNERTLNGIVKRLKNTKRNIIVGYVSALGVLAEYIEERNIAEVHVETIIPAGETLFDHQRENFERIFKGRVFNRYGSHEFTGIAHECDFHRGMHINAENLYVEVLKDGKPASPGELGEIVISDLQNFGMPLIRYGIEDLGAMAEGVCPCGRQLPLLERVEGRVYDVVRCPNGNIHTGTFFCKLTRSVAEIKQFQVIQEAKERIRLKLLTDGELQEASQVFLREMIKRYCGETMEVEFELVRVMEPLPSGKRRYVISLEHNAASAPR